LARSLKATRGFIQPIIVRKLKLRESYEIVAGERRWRAAKIAGMRKVPVVVKEYSSEEEARLHSLIENIDREDLTSPEREEAVTKLCQSGKWKTQRELAKALGRDESWVSQNLSIFKLRKKERISDDISTLTILQTRTLSPVQRKYLLTLVRQGKLSTNKVPEAVLAIRDGSIPNLPQTKIKELAELSHFETAKKLFRLMTDPRIANEKDLYRQVRKKADEELRQFLKAHPTLNHAIENLSEQEGKEFWAWVSDKKYNWLQKKYTRPQLSKMPKCAWDKCGEVGKHPRYQTLTEDGFRPASSPRGETEFYCDWHEFLRRYIYGSGFLMFKRGQMATSPWWKKLLYPIGNAPPNVQLPPNHPDRMVQKQTLAEM
jgi:ParB family chromosome partitioning protein